MIKRLSERRFRRHDPTILDAVASSPVFAGMPLDEIADIIDEFDEQHFTAGHRILLEGRTGTDFFLIVSGQALVTVAGRPILRLRRGDCFGEIGVLGDGSRVASVRASTPLRCLLLANGGLTSLLIGHPHLGVNLLRELAERFRALSEGGPAIDPSPAA